MKAATCLACFTSSLILLSCNSDPEAWAEDDMRTGFDCDHPLSHEGHLRQLRPPAKPPFDAVSDYIASMDRNERANWQQPDLVVKTLNLVGDELLADIGAGSGYFSFRFAEQLPWGSVLALDSEGGMVDHIGERAAANGLDNVSAATIDPEEPVLPEGIHMVFVCNVLHYLRDRRSWLCAVARQLDPGAVVVLIGFDDDAPQDGPARDRRLSTDEVRAHACAAGLVPVADHSDLLPLQFFLIFSKW